MRGIGATTLEPANGDNPQIDANPPRDIIYGWDWLVGSTVHVCVNSLGFAADPTNPSQCDVFHNTMIAASSGDPSFAYVEFDVSSDFDLQAGQYISMTDSTTTKEHQVTALTIDGVDAANDTVFGEADPGSAVLVIEDDGDNSLNPTTDGAGHWEADFTGLADLQPGSNGSALQFDADSDYTQAYWRIPDPNFGAHPDSDYIHARDWPEGGTVHLCIDSAGFATDATDPGQCDLYYTNDVVGPPDSAGSETSISFYLWGIHDLDVGDYVTMTDGSTVKQHQVEAMAVSGVDAGLDTVTGTADPGAQLEVWVTNCADCYVTVTADGFGNWTGDLSSIGQDILPGDSGPVIQEDADGDYTLISWQAPDPTVTAEPAFDSVFAEEWPEGATIHLCIAVSGFAADPTDPAQCDLFHDTGVVPPPSSGVYTSYTFDTSSEHDLSAGDYVSVTDGSTTKEHQVTDLLITDVDTAADTVSGTAAPSSDVTVTASSPYTTLEITADGSGDWSASFSGMVDIGVGTSGQASQSDPDGDTTKQLWFLTEPRIWAYIAEDQVEGYGWTLGNTLHLCVDQSGFPSDPTIPAQCSLHHTTQPVSIAPGGSYYMFTSFPLDGVVDILPEQYVTLSDGVSRRDLLVADLSITGWDLAADTLSGTADPNAEIGIDLEGCGSCYAMLTANGSGDWQVDLSGAADLQLGTAGQVFQGDADNDATVLSWEIPLHHLFLPLILR